MKPEDGKDEQQRVVHREEGDLDVVQRHRHVVFAGGVILLAALLVSEIHIVPFGVAWFVLGYAVTTLFWLTLVRWSRLRSCVPSKAALIIVALALRLPFLTAMPELSGDVFRYKWDGRVTASGVNPYVHAPDADELSDLRDEDHGLINHPEIPTIYPPLAQAFFWLWGLTGADLWLWRLLIVAVDLAIVRLSGSTLALVWATCPLVIFEGAWSGHLEVLVAALLLATWGVTVRRKDVAGGILLSAAAGLKVTPIVAAPVVIHASRSRVRSSVALLFGLAIPLLPFLGRPLMKGFAEYAVRWEFNGAFYEALKWIVILLELDERLKSAFTLLKSYLPLEWLAPFLYAHLYPAWIARALCFVPMAFLLVHAWKRPTIGSRIAWSVAALLLASPTLHPWYWLPIVPLAVVASEPLLLMLALASGMSYVWYVDAAVSQVASLLLCYLLPVTVWILLRKSSFDWRILDPDDAAGADRKLSGVPDV